MNRRKTLKFSTIRELLSYDDNRFLHCVYYVILGRKPDKEGLSVYRECLNSGLSKLEIIATLARSPEGLPAGIRTIWLDVLLRIRAVLNWPVVGPALKLLWHKVGITDIPSFFDPVFYLQEYPDVAKAHVAPYLHYVKRGEMEGRCPAFDSDWYQSEYPDIVASGLDPRNHYDKYGRAQKRYPCFVARWYLRENSDAVSSGLDAYVHYDRYGRLEGRQPAYRPYTDYRKWIAFFDTLSMEQRVKMKARCTDLQSKPLISIILTVCSAHPRWLRETLDSVRNQIYQNWELCVIYDLSMADVGDLLKRSALEDPRIKPKSSGLRGHVSAAKNAALELVEGKWIALLEADDLLAESALFWVVDAIDRLPDIAMVYSDEDKINGEHIRFSPNFKPDWNPDLFYSQNVASHLSVYLRSVLQLTKGFRADVDGAEDYDLTLRCLESIDPRQIHHIPRVLYHRRDTGTPATWVSNASTAGIRSLNEHLARLGVNANAEPTLEGCRVRYSLPVDPPLVSLIIPTRNGLRHLQKCVESILSRTTYKPFEILIVDNGSDDPETLRFLEKMGAVENIRVIHDDRPFNYSALNNIAVSVAKGFILGLINNDIEVINSDWLTEMTGHALRPDVAAVGAKLWYPDNSLQHGGIILMGGEARHAHKHIAKNDPGYMGRAALVQSLSAVTGACLLVRKSIYLKLGGLNEAALAISFNDVDFCIRALKAGYRNIWTPYAELYHHESATRGEDDTVDKRARARLELDFMQAQWPRELSRDPAYSPNLTEDCEDFSLAWPPRLDDTSLQNGF